MTDTIDYRFPLNIFRTPGDKILLTIVTSGSPICFLQIGLTNYSLNTSDDFIELYIISVETPLTFLVRGHNQLPVNVTLDQDSNLDLQLSQANILHSSCIMIPGSMIPGSMIPGSIIHDYVYVSTNGNDGGTGTCWDPVRTLTQADILVSDSGTIMVSSGNFELIAFSKDNLTVIGQSNSVFTGTIILNSRITFKTIQFSDIVEHTGPQIHLIDCKFYEDVTLGIGSEISTNVISDCEFNKTLHLNTNITNKFTAICSLDSTGLSQVTSVLNINDRVMIDPSRQIYTVTKIIDDSVTLSYPVSVSSTQTFCKVSSWLIKNSSMSLNLSLGHAIKGYNNIIKHIGSSRGYVSMSDPIIPQFTDVKSMRSETVPIGTLATADQSLWQCVDLSRWRMLCRGTTLLQRYPSKYIVDIRSSPPDHCNVGDTFMIDTNPTGTWSNKSGLAVNQDGLTTWSYTIPDIGSKWLLLLDVYTWDGSSFTTTTM